MKQLFHDVVQFIFFIISMTVLGIMFIGYAIYTLFYYLFSKFGRDTR